MNITHNVRYLCARIQKHTTQIDKILLKMLFAMSYK